VPRVGGSISPSSFDGEGRLSWPRAPKDCVLGRDIPNDVPKSGCVVLLIDKRQDKRVEETEREQGKQRNGQ
jgi:hypothetical protein